MAAGRLEEARTLIQEQLSDAQRLDLTWKIAPLAAAGYLVEAEALLQAQTTRRRRRGPAARDRVADSLAATCADTNARI